MCLSGISRCPALVRSGKKLETKLAREREPGKRRSGRLSAPVAGTPNNGRAAVWRALDTPTAACTPQET
eukprot:scaffold57886_cov24-Phaeocystis_antarctica.AAC.1